MHLPRRSAVRTMILFGAASLVLSLASAVGGEPSTAIVDRIVAVVGHDVVLLSELRAAERPFLSPLAGLPAAQRAPKEAELLRALLESMIEDRLLAQYARAQGLSVTAAEIDRAIDLAAAGAGVTRAELFAQMKKNGMSEAETRDEFQRQVLRIKAYRFAVAERVHRDAKMTDAEYDALVEKERAAWIARVKNETFVDVRL